MQHYARNHVISPLVDQHGAHLPPVVTMAAQFLWRALPGAPGIVVATPRAASGMVLMRALCVEDEPPPPDTEEDKDKHERRQPPGITRR